MILLRSHPEVANRDCNDCMLWMYNEQTGKPETRRGRRIPRHAGSVPCARGMCPKGNPSRQKTLQPHNMVAYQHYLECKATQSFPDDAIVRRNASLIEAAEQYCQRDEHSKGLLAIASIVKGVK